MGNARACESRLSRGWPRRPGSPLRVTGCCAKNSSVIPAASACGRTDSTLSCASARRSTSVTSRSSPASASETTSRSFTSRRRRSLLRATIERNWRCTSVRSPAPPSSTRSRAPWIDVRGVRSYCATVGRTCSSRRSTARSSVVSGRQPPAAVGWAGQVPGVALVPASAMPHLVPLGSNANATYFQGDTLHPTQTGTDEIAAAVAGVINTAAFESKRM